MLSNNLKFCLLNSIPEFQTKMTRQVTYNLTYIVIWNKNEVQSILCFIINNSKNWFVRFLQFRILPPDKSKSKTDCVK